MCVHSPQVTTLSDVMSSLQQLGEVNVKLSLHDSQKTDDGGIQFTQIEPVCFVLDALKEKRKKARLLGIVYYTENNSEPLMNLQ